MQRTAAIAGAVGALSLWWSAAAEAGVFEYAVDDGTGNVAFGTGKASLLWGNYFVVEGGNDLVTGISAAFNASVGSTVSLYVFDDPDDDFDPANAVLLSQATGVVTVGGMSAFNTFDVPDTVVSGGFYVAVRRDELASNVFPAVLDTATPRGRSWYATGTIDLDNLGGSTVFRNADEGAFPGNYMVRATAVPGPGVMVGLAGAGVVWGVRRRRGR